jgi:hypothetical protein
MRTQCDNKKSRAWQLGLFVGHLNPFFYFGEDHEQ